MVARPWSSSRLSCGDRLLLRCEGTPGILSRTRRERIPPLELGGGKGFLWMWAGLSCFLSSGDGYVGELLELQQRCALSLSHTHTHTHTHTYTGSTVPKFHHSKTYSFSPISWEKGLPGLPWRSAVCVLMEWSETSGGPWQWWHDPGVPLAFPVEIASS